MLGFIKKHFIPHAFIAIDKSMDHASISYMIEMEGRILKEDTKSYTIINGRLPAIFIKLIDSISIKYSLTYVSAILNAQVQSAVRNEDIVIEKSKRDNLNIVEVDNKWKMYCSKYEIEQYKDEFKQIDIDLIYSPFAILHYKCIHMKATMSEKNNTLFILAKKTNLAICAFENNVAVLSKNTIMRNFEEVEEDEESNTDELDDIFSGMSSDEAEKFDEMEDTFDDIDNEFELDIDMSDLSSGDKKHIVNETISKEDAESLGINLNSTIRQNVEEFIQMYYEKHDGDNFFTNIHIYNDSLITSNVTKYLEEELMMDIVLEDVVMTKLICDIARLDVLENLG